MLPLSNVAKASDVVLSLLLDKLEKTHTKKELIKIEKQVKTVADFQKIYEELMFEKYPGLEEYENWVKTA